MISNLAIRSLLNNGIELGWIETSSPIAVNVLIGIEGADFQILKSMYPKLTSASIHFFELPAGEFDTIRISAEYANGDTSFSDLYINVKNTLSRLSGAVAIDGSGVPKALKVDEGGNLLVSGITINSTGHGDASASLQSQQLTSINAIKTSVDSAKSSIDSVFTKLSDVRLANSQITDLKNVSINNFPSVYPSPDVVAAVNGLTSVLTTEGTLTSVLSHLPLLMRSSDVSRDFDGNIKVVVENLSPNVVAPATDNLITTLSGIVSELSDKVSELIVSGDSASSDLSLIETSATNIHDRAASIENSSMETMHSVLRTELTLTEMLDAMPRSEGLSDIETRLDSIVNAVTRPDYTSLNELKTSVVNLPSDYPNAEAQTTLLNILTQLSSINVKDTGITSPLPAGSNLIGSVAVNGEILLPANAATESSLIDVRNNIAAVLSSINATSATSIKGLLSSILSGITTINSVLSTIQEAVVLFSAPTSVMIPQMSKYSTGIIATPKCSELSVAIIMDENSSGTMTILTSDNGSDFYSISGLTRLPIIGGQMHIVKVPLTLKHVKVEVTNPSAYLQLTGVKLIVTQV